MRTASNSGAAAEVLAVFIDFAEQGEAELGAYVIHCGITQEDIDASGDLEAAILEHYRTPKGFDLNLVGYDLSRWPPIAARVRELKQQHREGRAAKERNRYRKSGGRKSRTDIH